MDKNRQVAKDRGWRDVGGWYTHCKGNRKIHSHGFPPAGNNPMCVPDFLARKQGQKKTATKKR